MIRQRMMNILAVDHGNESIKTPHCTFTAGLSVHKILPPLATEWILYEGMYYVLSQTPQIYAKDKTKDENYFIYTLFAACKEEEKKWIRLDQPVDLAIGLPPLHMATLREDFQKYFKRAVEKPICFRYCNEEKIFRIDTIGIYPQGYAAAYAYRTSERPNGKLVVNSDILHRFKRYLIVDIGGVTVDYIFFDDNYPVLEKCCTRMDGMNLFAEDVVQKILLNFGYELTLRDIVAVMRKEETLIPDYIRQYIKEQSVSWAGKILSAAENLVNDLRTVPCVFMGGGSAQLEDALKQHVLFPTCVEIVGDQKANAKGYEKLMKKVGSKRRR